MKRLDSHTVLPTGSLTLTRESGHSIRYGQRSGNYVIDGGAHRCNRTSPGGSRRDLDHGDVLIVIDAEGKLINEKDEMALDNQAASCIAPGMLGASILYGASSFEIGDCSGALICVLNLQFAAVIVEVPFTYQEPNRATKDGVIIVLSGSLAGTTVQAADPGIHLYLCWHPEL